MRSGGQPRRATYLTRSYWLSVLPVLRTSWAGEDCRTYTTASLARWAVLILASTPALIGLLPDARLVVVSDHHQQQPRQALRDTCLQCVGQVVPDELATARCASGRAGHEGSSVWGLRSGCSCYALTAARRSSPRR